MTLLIGFPGCLVTSFIQGGFLHIVMEYAENGDLCQAIDKKVIPIILSVCEREGGGGGGQCVLALSLPSPPPFSSVAQLASGPQLTRACVSSDFLS